MSTRTPLSAPVRCQSLGSHLDGDDSKREAFTGGGRRLVGGARNKQQANGGRRSQPANALAGDQLNSEQANDGLQLGNFNELDFHLGQLDPQEFICAPRAAGSTSNVTKGSASRSDPNATNTTREPLRLAKPVTLSAIHQYLAATLISPSWPNNPIETSQPAVAARNSEGAETGANQQQTRGSIEALEGELLLQILYSQ